MGVENDELIGSSIGQKYRLERRIGRGGMGEVYEAVHTGIGKRVALKFLDPTAGREADSVLRFQREAEAASSVESAHIVQIFDTGETAEGRPYLVMELLRGEDLRARLRRKERLAVTEAVHIARQVLRGLSRAHAAHIVHRDLKPDNIFLCARDDDPAFVKIVDFGVSKMKRQEKPGVVTSQGTVLGTVFYMSPEQAQAFPDIDGRADIYSVGAILFEALAGRPPHQGGSYESILVSICTEDAPDVRTFAPDVPVPVAKAIARALSRNRDARYPTADAFALALDEALTDSLAGTGPEVRRSRRVRRLRTIVIASVSALGALAFTALAVRANRGPRESSAPNSTAAYRPVTATEPVATVAPEPAAAVSVASSTTKAPHAPTATATARTHSGTPSTKPTASQSPSAAPPPPAASHQAVHGVADGLKLNLDEP